MKIRTACSLAPETRQAIGQLRANLGTDQPRLVVFFASPCHDPATIACGMRAAFPTATLLGCTTAGEIASGKMLKQSIVAMAFGTEIVADVHVEVVHGLRSGVDLRKAVAGFSRHFGESLSELDFRTHAGLVLCDGLSGAEEEIMEQLGVATHLLFVGGSAGDDLQFKTTHLFVDGEVVTDAAILAVLKVTTEIDVIKTQSFRILDRTLQVTRADEASRTVFEFDGKPAVAAYAEAVGTSVDKVSDEFMRHPVGLVAAGSPFVRSPQKVQGDSIVFYCNLKEGMKVNLLESTDIVGDTQAAVAAKEREWGKIAGLINFHCILRTLELESRGLTEAYGHIFDTIPTIGFSTYGEAFLGHINQNVDDACHPRFDVVERQGDVFCACRGILPKP